MLAADDGLTGRLDAPIEVAIGEVSHAVGELDDFVGDDAQLAPAQQTPLHHPQQPGAELVRAFRQSASVRTIGHGLPEALGLAATAGELELERFIGWKGSQTHQGNFCRKD